MEIVLKQCCRCGEAHIHAIQIQFSRLLRTKSCNLQHEHSKKLRPKSDQHFPKQHDKVVQQPRKWKFCCKDDQSACISYKVIQTYWASFFADRKTMEICYYHLCVGVNNEDDKNRLSHLRGSFIRRVAMSNT